MKNDIHELMCKTSPVQKEWKPKLGDTTSKGIFLDITKYTILQFNDAIWLPRQEDWQEIYYSQEEIKDADAFINVFDELPKSFDKQNMPDNAMFELMNSKITPSEIWTLLWCLFVHKEIYGLVWDWKENKWKKE